MIIEEDGRLRGKFGKIICAAGIMHSFGEKYEEIQYLYGPVFVPPTNIWFRHERRIDRGLALEPDLLCVRTGLNFLLLTLVND